MLAIYTLHAYKAALRNIILVNSELTKSHPSSRAVVPLNRKITAEEKKMFEGEYPVGTINK